MTTLHRIRSDELVLLKQVVTRKMLHVLAPLTILTRDLIVKVRDKKKYRRINNTVIRD